MLLAGRNLPVGIATSLLSGWPMKWKGEWQPGATYVLHDVVTDDGWLMVCTDASLEGTTQKPAPYPTGDREYYYTGTIGTTSTTAKQVIFGQRYTVTEPGFGTGWRLYTFAGQTYQVFTVDNPGTEDERIDQVITFTAGTTGWREFSLGARVLPVGVTFEVLALTQEPDPTPTTFAGDWTYDTPNNPSVPGLGEVTHANRDLAVMNFSDFDDASNDRSAELLSLSLGDTFDAGQGIVYTVQSAQDLGGYVAIGVSPTVQMSSDGLFTFTFETIAAQSTEYAVDTGYLAGDPNVSGVYIVDGELADRQLDDNHYGIDIQTQDAILSDRWAIAAYTVL